MIEMDQKNQNGQQFPQPPEPPRQGAVARFFAVAKALAGYGFVLMFFVMAGEKLLAPEYKPSTLMGRFAGATETAEIGAKQQAAVEYARQQAEAAAVAQANAAKKAELVGGSEGVNSFFAQLFDFGCMVGSVIPPNARDADTKNMGEALRSTCGAGDQIRSKMAHDLDEAGRPR
jgi:hypothetical protein